MTFEEFAKEYGITIFNHPASSNPNMADMLRGSSHWRCTLRRGELGVDYREITIPFSQGPAIKDVPTVEDLLDCLASDASCVESGQSFEDFCSMTGYDTDSRKAERTYNAIISQTNQLRTFLGNAAFTTLLDCERL